jgi:alkylation response protein AidB-like acyl-CoA dehydrogenase
VDFSLDDEQSALVASFADLLSAHSPPERVRAAEPAGFDPELWRALREVGIVEMAVPDSRGGWGAGVIELALVAEQLGAFAASAPAVEAQVAARLLASLDGEAAGSALGAVIDGDRLVTIAVRPVEGGVAALVPGGAVADAAVVIDGDRVALVPLGGDGGRRQVSNLAAAPLADVTVGADAELLAEGPSARAAYESAIDEWLLLTAAELVGLASSALRITCEYARERQAWGTPIGAYQGVAHPLADGATVVDGARLLVREAAWELGRGGARGAELAAMAFAFASEMASKVTYDAVHFHGGVGFTLEADPQLYYRRARGWARVWGEPLAAYRRAARARYGLAKGA